MLVRVDGGYCRDQIGSASFACHFSCISKLQIEITDICSEFQIYQKPALAKKKNPISFAIRHPPFDAIDGTSEIGKQRNFRLLCQLIEEFRAS